MNREIIVNSLRTKEAESVCMEVDFLPQIVILKGGILGQRKELKNA